MKKILTILFTVITFCAFSQAPKQLTAGDELLKAQRHYIAGTVISGIGVSLTMFSTITMAKDTTMSGRAPFYLGSGMIIIGTIFCIESWLHVGNAGRLLNNKDKLSFTGNSVRYTF